MSNNSRDFRVLRIAAVILYRVFPDVTLQISDNTAYDILSAFPSTGLRFGIRIVSSSFSESNTYEHYLDYLDEVDYSDKDYRIPIVLMAVNESAETAKIGIQVGWRVGRPVIFKKTTMMNVTNENANRILDAVKSMDETIRILSEHGMKIIKTIYIEKADHNGYTHRAKMVYLRDFTEEYKMKPKVDVEEREKFNRLLTVIPENEYPDDFLDNSILAMVRQKFPDANMKSRIMLFSSELQSLQSLSQSIRINAEMFVEPNLHNVPDVVLHMLEGLQLLHFKIDIFVEVPSNRTYFENLSFSKTEHMEGWMEKYINYSKAIATLHSPVEFFI